MICVHRFRVEDHRHLGFQPLQEQRASYILSGQRSPTLAEPFALSDRCLVERAAPIRGVLKRTQASFQDFMSIDPNLLLFPHGPDRHMGGPQCSFLLENQQGSLHLRGLVSGTAHAQGSQALDGLRNA